MCTIQEPGILLGEHAVLLLVDGSLCMYWIKAEQVEKVWPQIENAVKRTLRYDGVLTLDEIQTSLKENDSQLFLVLESGEFHTLGIFELLRDGFGQKFCRIVSLLGKDLVQQPLFLRCVEEWARGNGCVRLTASVTEAGARLFRRFGFTVRNVEIAKEL